MATINGVEVIGDKTAHDFDLLDKDDGINLANGIERNREATEDNHADIVRHRTDTDVHVTPAWKNSLVTKEILGLYWTAAQTADIINEISIAGGAKLVKVDELPETGKEQTIYLVPKTDPQEKDIFDEYVWVDGKYEFIGTTKVDLSNYATKTELNAKQDALSAQQLSNIADVVNKANASDLTAHTNNADIHVTPSDKANWNAKQDALSNQQIQNIADVANKANDADVVHNSGDETIGGVKSFSNNTYFTSLNSTNEVESQSSSGTAILPLIATMTYADQSPSQTARLNLRVTADGIKSLYPHENSAYSLGLSSCFWSDLYACHGYFRGQQQNDEYSVNARTNLTLLANRDTLGTSGVVFDTFRENTAQGKGAHILGFGMKENSIRYEGCRFQWSYDSINLGYDFYLKPNVQGTNTPLTYNLGTSADKWTDVNTNAINGLNPGALSFPSLTKAAFIDVDTTDYVWDGTTANLYTSEQDGYLLLLVKNTNIIDNGCLCLLTPYDALIGYVPIVKDAPPVLDRYDLIGAHIYSPAGTRVIIKLNASSVFKLRFVPCQGNV